MSAFAETLVHTPWWVYVLFVFLLIRGIKARRGALISPRKLAVVPLIFTLWGGWNMMTLFPVTIASVLTWIVALTIGWQFGAWLVRAVAVRADRKRGLMWRPPDYTFLPLLLAIFAIKYVFGFLMGTHPELIHDPVFYLTDIAASGLITGVFIGKFVGVLQKYYRQPPEDLGSLLPAKRTDRLDSKL